MPDENTATEMPLESTPPPSTKKVAGRRPPPAKQTPVTVKLNSDAYMAAGILLAHRGGRPSNWTMQRLLTEALDAYLKKHQK